MDLHWLRIQFFLTLHYITLHYICVLIISVRNLHCILLLHITHSSKVNCTLDKVNCTLCIRKHTILGPDMSKDLMRKPSFTSYSEFDKGWKLSSRVDRIGSAVLRKPGSGRPTTASACALCRYKNFSIGRHTMTKNNVISEKLHFHFLAE